MDIHICVDYLCQGTRSEQKDAIESLLSVDYSKITECLIKLIEREDEQAMKEKCLLLLKVFAFPRTNMFLVERMYKSEDPFVRNAAIDLMWQADMDFLSTMSRLSEDPDKDVRKFVIDTLIEHSSKEAVQIVTSCLNDPEKIVRQAALEALGQIGIKSTATFIEDQLDRETNLMIRCTCFESLFHLGHSPNSEDIIKKYANETNPMIIFSFIRYLGAFGQPNDLALIEKFLIDKGDFLLQPAATSAAKIVIRYKTITLSDLFIEKIQAAILSQKNENVIWELSRALLFGMGDKGVEHARHMLKSDIESSRTAAQEYLSEFGTEEDQKSIQTHFDFDI